MPHVHLPSTVALRSGAKPTEGQLIVEPCAAGFGTTLGNALRRVLLASLPGAAVTDVKIQGVEHEFSALAGVKEDVVEILLNVKQIRLKVFSDEPVRLTLAAKGETTVTAGDIEKNAAVEIVNPKVRIATLTDANAEFSMELIVRKGQGYDPIEAREDRVAEIGLLAVDSLYTPVRNVGFQVEHVRVGQMTNYDRLILTVETDGTITVKEAIEQAAQILIDHFSFLTSLGEAAEKQEKADEPAVAESVVEAPAEDSAAKESGDAAEDDSDEEKKTKKKK